MTAAPPPVPPSAVASPSPPAVPAVPAADVRSAGRRWAGAVCDGARDLAGLVVPVACAGCGRCDVALCAACGARFAGPPWRCEDGAARLDRTGRAPLPVWTLTPYTGPVRGIVVGWKDRGRADLTPFLTAALAAAARAVAPVLAAAVRAPLLVVPAPSSSAARRRRGADVVGTLAAAVARGLRDAGVPATAAPVLAQRRGARDQVGLTARDRRANVGDRVRVRWPAAVSPLGHPVVLVDDVLTTGATLVACDDVLRAAGAPVVAALTLAATPAPANRSRGGPATPGLR